MNPKREELEFGIFEIVILILSVYVLLIFTVETLVPIAPETQDILDESDTCVCVFFLADFLIRLWKAPSKLGYMKWGWIDLLSSIPVFQIFYHLRWLRMIRFIRILRAFRSTQVIVRYLYTNRARSGLISVVLMALLVSVFGAVAELNFETAPESNIKTAEDALWWAFSTVTTVSCEKYPVTEGGRIVAVLLMIAGVLLFGTISAYIASVFLEPMQQLEESELKELLTEMKLLREKMAQIEQINQRLLESVNIPKVEAPQKGHPETLTA